MMLHPLLIAHKIGFALCAVPELGSLVSVLAVLVSGMLADNVVNVVLIIGLAQNAEYGVPVVPLDALRIIAVGLKVAVIHKRGKVQVQIDAVLLLVLLVADQMLKRILFQILFESVLQIESGPFRLILIPVVVGDHFLIAVDAVPAAGQPKEEIPEDIHNLIRHRPRKGWRCSGDGGWQACEIIQDVKR